VIGVLDVRLKPRRVRGYRVFKWSGKVNESHASTFFWSKLQAASIRTSSPTCMIAAWRWALVKNTQAHAARPRLFKTRSATATYRCECRAWSILN